MSHNLTPPAQAFSEIAIEIFRLNRLLLDAGDALAHPSGLTSARWQVMGIVEHGPISVSQVGRVMGLTRQGVQQTADSLAAEGLIVYSVNPHHRRAKLMSLTPAGRAALDEVQARHAGWADRLGRQYTLEELQALLDQLRRIEATLETEQPNE